MGDWRKMGSSARRRMGAPTNHAAGAPRIVEVKGEKKRAEASQEGARTEKRT